MKSYVISDDNAPRYVPSPVDLRMARRHDSDMLIMLMTNLATATIAVVLAYWLWWS